MVNYFTSIWRMRHFWFALVRVDLRRSYRHSILGLGWSLLMPLAMTVVLCTVFSRLFNVDVRNFGPYLLAGLTVWNFISAVMMQGCQAFLQGESYIRQHPAPLAIYPLRATLGAGTHVIAGLVVVLGLAWCLQGPRNPLPLISLVPTMALLFVFAWALASVMALINVLFQDTQHLTQVFLQVAFYLTPILYTPKMLHERNMEWLVQYNPLAAFMELIRAPIVDGRFPPLSAYALAAVAATAAVGLATFALSRYERRLIFYL